MSNSRRSNQGRMGQMVMGSDNNIATNYGASDKKNKVVQGFEEDWPTGMNDNINDDQFNKQKQAKPFQISNRGSNYVPTNKKNKTDYPVNTYDNQEKELMGELDNINRTLNNKREKIENTTQQMVSHKYSYTNVDMQNPNFDKQQFGNTAQSTVSHQSSQKAKPFKINKNFGGDSKQEFGNFSTTTSSYTNQTGGYTNSNNSKDDPGMRHKSELGENSSAHNYTMSNKRMSLNQTTPDDRTIAGAKFQDRFKMAMNREKNMTINKKEVKETKPNQSKVTDAMAKAFKREDNVNKFEEHEERVVGESDMNTNIQMEEVIYNDEELIECTEGCGRSFREGVLEKHKVACRKVFQTKRKEFDTKKKRVIDNEQIAQAKKGERNAKMTQPTKKNAAKGAKNWKKDSDKFRDFINKQKTEQQGKEEIVVAMKNKEGKVILETVVEEDVKDEIVEPIEKKAAPPKQKEQSVERRASTQKKDQSVEKRVSSQKKDQSVEKKVAAQKIDQSVEKKVGPPKKVPAPIPPPKKKESVVEKKVTPPPKPDIKDYAQPDSDNYMDLEHTMKSQKPDKSDIMVKENFKAVNEHNDVNDGSCWDIDDKPKDKPKQPECSVRQSIDPSIFKVDKSLQLPPDNDVMKIVNEDLQFPVDGDDCDVSNSFDRQLTDESGI